MLESSAAAAVLTAWRGHALCRVQPCYSWWEVPYYWAGLKVRRRRGAGERAAEVGAVQDVCVSTLQATLLPSWCLWGRAQRHCAPCALWSALRGIVNFSIITRWLLRVVGAVSR